MWGAAASVSLADMADKTKHHAPKLLEAAQGKIRLLGISSAAKNAETIAQGLSNEVSPAVATAQALAELFAEKNQPVQIILDGKAWNGNPADLKDYKTDDKNRVSLLLGGTVDTNKNASVGVLLGTLAALPVQRNIARVKNGALPIRMAVFTNGLDIGDNATKWQIIHDKGYIFFRTYPGKAGYFFNDDPTLTANTSDFS